MNELYFYNQIKYGMTKKNYKLLILFTLLQCSYVHSQTCETEQIVLDNGASVFNVCKSNVAINYKDNLEYNWYSEFSGVQKTKGGSSGKLLNGKFQEFWPDGKLHFETQYSLGLENGTNKEWNKNGDLFATMKYKMGVIVYSKQKNDEGNWVEFKGPLLQPKSERNIYDGTGKVILEKKIWLNSIDTRVFVYYPFPDSGKIKYFYTENSILHWWSDSFVRYYINGKVEVAGKLSNDSRDGIWRYYDETGKLTGTEKYRIHKEYYPTGKLKLSVGEFYDDTEKTWVKHGRWIWWEENGEFPLRDEKYKMGEVVLEKN